ncbi:S-adenosyl-L-methionine-dependent methyltransferase [Gautieria morchelliformis]|nr:S-adenosyl-L-methionine-dependent methyltransferase [Gautieria morchelliformis]
MSISQDKSRSHMEPVQFLPNLDIADRLEPDVQPQVEYVLSHVCGAPKEIERLDDMHEAIKFYLGGGLSLAPLEVSISPRSILEIGCGSGAWAIQAAEIYPDADVLAVDLSALPSRPLPPNLRFQILDCSKPLPFAAQAFDIVHGRFVFRHLPGFEDALSRTMQLVKPGGWLLLEDADAVLQEGDSDSPDPGNHEDFWTLLHQCQARKNMNTRAGSAFQEILESSELFSEVRVRRIVVPVSKCEDSRTDVGVRRIAESFRRSISQVIAAMRRSSGMKHLNSAIFDAAEYEIHDPSRDMQMELYMTWSKRKE